MLRRCLVWNDMVLNIASNSRFLTESMVKYGAESPVELIFNFFFKCFWMLWKGR